MLLTTTDNLQGIEIRKYLGIVVGQAVIGEEMTKNFRTGIRDISQGGRHDHAEEFDRARQTASNQMVERASSLGANAVIGVAHDFETSGEHSHIVIVSVFGTAVVMEPAQK